MTSTGSDPRAAIIRPEALDLRIVQREISHVLDAQQSTEEKALALIELVMRLTNAAAGVFFHVGGDGGVVAGPRYLSTQALTWSDALLGEMAQHAQTSIAEDATIIRALDRRAEAKTISVPTTDADGRVMAITVLLRLADEPIENFVVVVALAAVILARLTRTKNEERFDAWQLFVDVQQILDQSDWNDDVASALIEQLRQFFACDQLVLALQPRAAPKFELFYSRALAGIDRRSDLVRAMSSAFAETRQIKLTKSGAIGDNDAQDSILLREVGKTLGAEASLAACASPHGRLAVLLVWEHAEHAQQQSAIQLQKALQIIEPAVLLARGEPSRMLRSMDGAKQRSLAAAGLAIVLAVIMMLPLPYRVGADVVLEAAERRFVVAPFDATLEQANFTPGDAVAAGDVLAVLDSKELLLEIEGTVAELEKLANRRRSALAAGSTSEAQLAQFEIEKLNVRAQLLAARREQIRITAPIDGVLLAGDLKRNTGSPLRIGQTLFEISPLDRLAANVQIPAHALEQVETGMAVVLQFESLPNRRYETNLNRIRPRAEIIANENVFIGEADVLNQSGELKPGMTGTAKVRGPRRRVGWILFHRAWHALRIALW